MAPGTAKKNKPDLSRKGETQQQIGNILGFLTAKHAILVTMLKLKITFTVIEGKTL